MTTEEVWRGVWDWFLDLFRSATGQSVERVEIKGIVEAPLFYPYNGKVCGTWDYFSNSPEQRQAARDFIKAQCKPGNTPMITGLATSRGNNGDIVDDAMNVNESKLSDAKAICIETIKDGCGIVLTGFCDDADPRWRRIANYGTALKRIGEVLGPYVNIALLSIESDQKEDSGTADNITAGVAKLREYMPQVPKIGTHMQFHTRSDSGTYAWTGWKTNPRGCDVIFLEFPWFPGKGDAEGLAGIKRDFAVIAARMACPIVWQEFNLNPSGGTYKAQREWLLQQKPFGVGAVEKDRESVA
jgi:hypothetical protein